LLALAAPFIAYNEEMGIRGSYVSFLGWVSSFWWMDRVDGLGNFS
jgi:hypothetical protein